MIVYAASRRTLFVHSAVVVVTSRRPLGIVTAVVNDRLSHDLSIEIVGRGLGPAASGAVFRREQAPALQYPP